MQTPPPRHRLIVANPIRVILLPHAAVEAVRDPPGQADKGGGVGDNAVVDFDVVLRILQAFQDANVRYVLIGAFGLAVHGLVRATKDLDVFIAPDAGNVERLKGALHSVFRDESIAEISAADLAGPYPAIRYVPPDGSFVIDLMSRLGDAFRFEDLEVEEHVVEGVRISVATPATLYRMKKDTRRGQDSMRSIPACAGKRVWTAMHRQCVPVTDPIKHFDGRLHGWSRRENGDNGCHHQVLQ